MAKGRTVLTEKKMAKEEFGTISLSHTGCLPTMWKFLAGIFTANVVEQDEANDISPNTVKMLEIG